MNRIYITCDYIIEEESGKLIFLICAKSVIEVMKDLVSESHRIETSSYYMIGFFPYSRPYLYVWSKTSEIHV